MKTSWTTETFVDHLKKIYPDYDFSKSAYLGPHEFVEYFCSNPEHGAQNSKPNTLLRGSGCRLCNQSKNGRISKNPVLSQNSFKEIVLKNYPKFDLSMTAYKGTDYPVEFNCGIPGHPNSWAHPITVKRGGGCKICEHSKRYSKTPSFQEDTRKKLYEIFPEYDFSNSEFRYQIDDCNYYCIPSKRETHGMRTTQLINLLRGFGCKECAKELAIQKIKAKGFRNFNRRFKENFPEYEIQNPGFIDYKTKVPYTCENKEHGVKYSWPNSLINGYGCPECSGHGKSYGELELKAFIVSLGIKVKSSYTLKNNKELDILCPDYNIAFEYNGVYFHSEKFRPDPNYHLNKTLAAKEEGIRLIHIWEDDWENNKEVVKGRIRALFLEEEHEFEIPREDIIKISLDYGFDDRYERNGFKLRETTPPKYRIISARKRLPTEYSSKQDLKALFPEYYDEEKTAEEICEEAGTYRVFSCGEAIYEYTNSL